MAYADQRMSTGRIWAIVIVALIHALLGYAFVTGLATSVIERVKEDLKTFDVEEPPPPEEEPPPPPPDQPTQPPPISAPPVAVRIQTQNPVQATQPQPQTTFTPDPPREQVQADPGPQTKSCPNGQVVPINASCPEPPSQARSAEHRSGSISNDDYPAAAQRAEAQGTTVARFTVGPDGRVTSCTIASSSGNSSLDSTTCSLIQRRFRYRPALDRAGNPTSETKTQRVTWRLPDE